MTTEKITQIQGTAVPVRGNDIDTDRIIPARYLKEVTFNNMGKYAFYDVCYDGQGNKTDHPFVNEKYSGASVLVVNKNFGCGSSREHAPQALMRWGIKAILGESFAEIFAGNCTMLGIPIMTATEDEIQEIMQSIENDPSQQVSVNLDTNKLGVGQNEYATQMNPSAQKALTQGTWDSTSLLLSNKDDTASRASEIPYLNSFQ